MTLFITVVTILQSFAVSLGVGSSTLAIINFFVAIADGKIDETERRMMGVVYKVLRVAMVAILVTTIPLLSYQFGSLGVFNMPGFAYAQLFTLVILFVNSMLMTAHLMPSTFGPAIQAGSWYTLGTLASLPLLGFINFSFWHFLMAYIAWIILAIGIVNGIMSIQKSKRKEKTD